MGESWGLWCLVEGGHRSGDRRPPGTGMDARVASPDTEHQPCGVVQIAETPVFRGILGRQVGRGMDRYHQVSGISAISNLAGLRGMHAFSKASREMATAMERLSTGKKLNRASDDPSGMQA